MADTAFLPSLLADLKDRGHSETDIARAERIWREAPANTMPCLVCALAGNAKTLTPVDHTIQLECPDGHLIDVLR